MACRTGRPRASARGIDLSTADAFLTPKLKRPARPQPLKDMDAAASRSPAPSWKRERVAVFGDYDVDGATSSALLRRFFRAAGSDLTVYIPIASRKATGQMRPHCCAPEGGRHQPCRDGGSRGHLLRPAAAAAGSACRGRPPWNHARRAVAVVNPNRKDDASPHKTLAAVASPSCWSRGQPSPRAGRWNDRRSAPDSQLARHRSLGPSATWFP